VHNVSKRPNESETNSDAKLGLDNFVCKLCWIYVCFIIILAVMRSAQFQQYSYVAGGLFGIFPMHIVWICLVTVT